MKYMLDTNICIHLMKSSPPAVALRFDGLRRGDAVISVITFAELRYGIEVHSDAATEAEQALNDLVDAVPVLPFDESAAHSYGVVRAAVRDRKRNALDRLIAAHALAHDLILVTNNVDDFIVYPGLAVENWLHG